MRGPAGGPYVALQNLVGGALFLDAMRYPLLALIALLIPGCVSVSLSSAPSPERARDQLARAERAWLDAYDDDDREVMSQTLADGFTITFPDGTVQTRQDVIDGLDPDDSPDADGSEDDRSHYTEGRAIRVIGRTAILSGVYVNPGDDGEPDVRMRYTDTWMWLDGRWQVVASHLSSAGR